jgi:hypothetical protein
MSKSLKDSQKDYERYMNTYECGSLLRKHSLTEEGVWHVYGEDPNCDMGGHHSNPYLGLFEGTLDDVIREAVSISGFFQWGSGGKIEKTKTPVPVKVKTKAERGSAELEELVAMKAELKAALAKVDAKLNQIK